MIFDMFFFSVPELTLTIAVLFIWGRAFIFLLLQVELNPANRGTRQLILPVYILNLWFSFCNLRVNLATYFQAFVYISFCFPISYYVHGHWINLSLIIFTCSTQIIAELGNLSCQFLHSEYFHWFLFLPSSLTISVVRARQLILPVLSHIHQGPWV